MKTILEWFFGEQDTVAMVWTLLIAVTIMAVVSVIPLTVLFLFWQNLHITVILLLLGVAVVGSLAALGYYWEKNVPQNPEFTNTIQVFPNGERRVYTQTGPVFLRPGAVIEGNQIPRNIVNEKIEFAVNRGKVTVNITANVRYFVSDGSRLSHAQKQRLFDQVNQLGKLYPQTIREALKGYLEKSADIVVQDEERFRNLDEILNHKGAFLQAIEKYFRRQESELEQALGIEIVDKDKKGIDLVLSVPKEVQDKLLEVWKQEMQMEAIERSAAKLVKTAKENGQSMSYEEALDQAAGIISGNIQRYTGKAARNVNTIVPGGQES